MRKPDRLRADPAARDRETDVSRPELGLAGELRDTELAISLWRQRASEFDGVPPPTAFDFSSMIAGTWNHRFVICTDAVVGELTFLIYGSRFAQLLELPAEPISGTPIAQQLPGRYLSLFTEGCREAIAQSAPVRLSGAVVDYGQIELYRAAFMPLAMRQHSLMRLVFGSFNRRIGFEAHSTDAVRATYNSIFEEIQLAKAVAASSSESAAPGSSVDGPNR
jgi:hypothetical protein